MAFDRVVRMLGVPASGAALKALARVGDGRAFPSLTSCTSHEVRERYRT